MTPKEPKDFEKLGYDSFIDLWIREGSCPRASLCPARFMREERERSLFLKGWTKAKKELENQNTL